jgi:ACS family glucarate transporter-like MFS transporter
LKKRHLVLLLVALISALTFLDRMSIAVVGPAIQRDFPISPVQWGWILSAYVIAYSVFEIPSGVLGDRRGYHRELSRIALWWSAFISLTAFCRTVWQFAGARFLFGLGAAGAYPNLTGMLYRWMPVRERARGQGVMWAAGRLGGGLAPLLLVPLEAAAGWRAVFLILGVAGFLWAMSWQRLIRDRPAEQPGISAAELVEIGATPPPSHDGTPWKKLARLPQLWLIAAAYGMYGSGPWFYFSWFPTWLVKSAGFSIREMGVYASLPFFLGVAANLAGGQICDRLALHLGMRRAYAGMSCVCLLLTGLIMMALSVVHTKWLIIVLASLGFGAMDLMLPCAWSMCMAIGGRVGGTATAVMNTVGNLGGLFCTFGFGYILEATGSYEMPVRAVAIMVILSGLIFSTIDCGRGLDAEFAARPL